MCGIPTKLHKGHSGDVLKGDIESTQVGGAIEAGPQNIHLEERKGGWGRGEKKETEVNTASKLQ